MNNTAHHTPAVKLSGVTLCRNRQTVLDAVDFSISPGEFIGVLGPNGSGKSTLFRALLGILPGVTGEIQVFGAAPGKTSHLIGYLPQLRADVLDTAIRGWDFVASAYRPARWGLPIYRAADRREIDAAIRLVEAKDLARRPLSALSGGERQRLLLAQALLGKPRMLLLDEPLASLDPHYQAEVVALIRRVQQQRQVTVLFTSHELNPLLGAIDRVLYLGGKQAAIGSVEAVVTGPVLSRLYGMPIEVVHTGSHYFVVAAESGVAAEAGAHHVCL